MNAFGYEVDQYGAGHIVNHRPAEYQVELLQNGYARVDHRASGLTELVEPATGRVLGGAGHLPNLLIIEIHERWGRT